MLYGKNDTSKGTTPINTLSYRGYPTPILNMTLVKEVVSDDKRDYAGNVVQGTASERYAIVSVLLSATYKLPYDNIIRVRLGYNGTPFEDMYLKIASGNSETTHYSKDNITWTAISGEVYFYKEISQQTGDKTIALDRFISYVPLTLPHYGDTDTVKNVIITYAEVVPPSSFIRIGDTDNLLVSIEASRQVFMCNHPSYPDDIYIDPIHYGSNNSPVYYDENQSSTPWEVDNDLASDSLGIALDTVYRELDESFYIDTSDTYNGSVRVVLLVPIDANSKLVSTVVSVDNSFSGGDCS